MIYASLPAVAHPKIFEGFMFTGIVSGLGEIVDIKTSHDASLGVSVTVKAPANYLNDVQLGDSIAMNGACMTVTNLESPQSRFIVDVSTESLSKTVGLNRRGPINLEKALRAQDFLGGHLVSGHVDGVGEVSHLAAVGESIELRICVPVEFGKFLAYKGSLAVNGVSLTVNTVEDAVNGCQCSINLIPHTLQSTTLGRLRVGDKVNLEVDLIARYVARMLEIQKKTAAE